MDMLGGDLKCMPKCTSSQFSYFGWDLLSTMLIAAFYGLILGTLPGIAALTLTPAKMRPWRSLPALVLGTLLGFVIWWYVGALASSKAYASLDMIWAALFLIPTATGLIVACNIGRLPKPLRP